MAEEKLKKSEKISEDLKDLIIYRLDTLPEDKKISIGSIGEFFKSDLIEHVRKEDEIGKEIVELELTFLRALKEGILLKDILTSDQ